MRHESPVSEAARQVRASDLARVPVPTGVRSEPDVKDTRCRASRFASRTACVPFGFRKRDLLPRRRSHSSLLTPPRRSLGRAVPAEDLGESPQGCLQSVVRDDESSHPKPRHVALRPVVSGDHPATTAPARGRRYRTTSRMINCVIDAPPFLVDAAQHYARVSIRNLEDAIPSHRMHALFFAHKPGNLCANTGISLR